MGSVPGQESVNVVCKSNKGGDDFERMSFGSLKYINISLGEKNLTKWGRRRKLEAGRRKLRTLLV